MSCGPSISKKRSFFGFSTTSCTLAPTALPLRSVMSPAFCSSNRPRPWFTGSLATATRAFSGTSARRW